MFLTAFLGLAIFITSAAGNILSLNKTLYSLVQMILLCSAAVAGYWLYCKLIENRKVHEMDLTKMWKQMGFGLMLGLVFISMIILLMAAFGNYKITGFNPVTYLVPILIMSVQAGITEEIVSRGVVFRIVEEGAGTWISALISAFIFGFLHIWNPNATVFSSISIALTAGVILALLYVITRQLWVPIGMHIGWNFTLGGIWGAPVSGSDPAGMLKAQFTGPDWMTGGSFGPEASVITLAIFLIFGTVLAVRVIRNRSYIKPLWSHSND
jgi:membrane protease YdiL (CAAX protease family)